jgi:hypothetical protein
MKFLGSIIMYVVAIGLLAYVAHGLDRMVKKVVGRKGKI